MYVLSPPFFISIKDLGIPMNFLNMLLLYEDVVAIFLMAKERSHLHWGKVIPFEKFDRSTKVYQKQTSSAWIDCVLRRYLEKKLKERATSYNHLVIHYTPTYFSPDVLVLCRLGRMPFLKQVASVKMTHVRSQSHWNVQSTLLIVLFQLRCLHIQTWCLLYTRIYS